MSEKKQLTPVRQQDREAGEGANLEIEIGQPGTTTLEAEPGSRPVSTLLAHDLLTNEAKEYADMRQHITLSPKQTKHLDPKQTNQKKAPGRSSAGQNSILESHETFGEVMVKANAPGHGTASGEKRTTTGTLGAQRIYTKPHDQEEDSQESPAGPENRANSKQISLNRGLEISQPKKSPKNSQRHKASRQHSLAKGINGPILATSPRHASLKQR